jgi:hypothetical protein
VYAFSRRGSSSYFDGACAHASIGYTLSRLKKHDQALAIFTEEHVKRSALLGEDHADTLNMLNNIGAELGHLLRPQEALEAYARVLVSRERTLGEEHDDTLRSIMNVTNAHGNLYQYAEQVNEAAS